ncbi:hypothetical protein BY458DRAFT_502508 [Sporodiniella umbellata]|nr:hypothetical protein BY458DRAFT_502508 [Sporodiniella umbellata]
MNNHEYAMTETPLNAYYDLQQVIQIYRSQPELLKLILTSKVEEDKRRTEEAKLKAKELDLLLKHTPTKRKSSFAEESIEKRRHSAAAAMLAMGSGGTIIPEERVRSESESHEEMASAYPSPIAEEEEYVKPGGRKRREMQAITKIVETREFPYVDRYFWKNNGNTVQKKTGCKSIYYKCSNSNKGCTVNKTVTERLDGEYLIKYRGCHLKDCGQVERIRDL